MIAVAEPVEVGISELSAERARRRSLCGRVDDDLGVGDVVDGGDHTSLDPDLLVQHLHHRCETVRRARRSGHDVIGRRVVEVIVAAHHHVEHAVGLHRRRHDHLAHTGGEVRLQRLGGLELAAALQHDVDAVVGPGHLARGAVPTPGDGAAVDRHPVAVERDLARVPAVHGVELEQVCPGRRVSAGVVDRHHLEVGVLLQPADDQSPDPAESVDADALHRTRMTHRCAPEQPGSPKIHPVRMVPIVGARHHLWCLAPTIGARCRLRVEWGFTIELGSGSSGQGVRRGCER